MVFVKKCRGALFYLHRLNPTEIPIPPSAYLGTYYLYGTVKNFIGMNWVWTFTSSINSRKFAKRKNSWENTKPPHHSKEFENYEKAAFKWKLLSYESCIQMKVAFKFSRCVTFLRIVAVVATFICSFWTLYKRKVVRTLKHILRKQSRNNLFSQRVKKES